jgi:CTP-dependent riboflavin kinase
MKITLTGRIHSGKNDASYWLQRFHAPYCQKTGMDIFPGSLNLELEASFDWYAKRYRPHIVWFGRDEYGGERDILLLPCILSKLDRKQAFLWTTTTAAHDRPNKNLIEVITDVPLRASYGLVDGDRVDVELSL